MEGKNNRWFQIVIWPSCHWEKVTIPEVALFASLPLSPL